MAARKRKKPDPRTDAPDDQDLPGRHDNNPPDLELDRNEDLSTRPELEEALRELYVEVERGFEEQWERSDEQMNYWDIFNCKLGEYQYYAGNSRIFLPIVHNAINARCTRFVNQMFPQSGRTVEVTTTDGTLPHAEMSLAEYYIRRAKLRTKVAPALLRNGDVEGQYSLYVSWQKKKRYVTWKTIDPLPLEEELSDPTAETEEIRHEEIEDAGPHVEVLADCDLLILPHTADSVEEALEMGGSVTVLRRWSKAKIKQQIADGDIEEDSGETLLKEMSEKKEQQVNKKKEMVTAAGIKTSGGGSKHALVYETWSLLTVDSEEEGGKTKQRRLCVTKFGGDHLTLSCRRNPNWNDRCPVISVPVEKIQGVFKGQSKVKPCAQTQYYANDAINEAADSSMYALMPIVMTDPNKNPRVGSMVLSLAAVWQVDPNSTKFAQMPELWKQGFEIVAACKSEIAQTLSVSPAAITQTNTAKTKRSQAEVAQEQQVDVLMTADAVTVLEEGVLTPLLNWFIELDHQFRNKAMTIPEFGEMGRRANMEQVEPIQFSKKYHFRWFGVEAARNAQQTQLQIAMTNVLRGIPPQQYEGHRLNMVPLITQLVENTYGPRLAPLIFEDMAAQMPVPVDQENLLLAQGFEVPTHQLDDDQQHIQGHMMMLQQPGAGHQRKIHVHIFAHMQQAQRKQAMAQQLAAAQQGGMPGAPGGAGPGMAGTPRPGAMPGQPRMQGPAGMMHPDQVGPTSGAMPRMRTRG